MASAKAALTGRVLDFYRQFALQDMSKAAIALSMNIPPKELFAMLAEKYSIDHAKVRNRLELYDTVEEYFRRHCPAELAQVEVAMKMQCEPDELLRRVRVLVAKTAKSPTGGRGYADPHRNSPGRTSSVQSSRSGTATRLSAHALLPPPPPEPEEFFSPLAAAPMPQPPYPSSQHAAGQQGPPPLHPVSITHSFSMTSGPALNDSAVQATSPTPEEKTAALTAREEALNARSLALATLNPGVQIVASAVEDRHIENFYRRLVLIEGELFAKLVALEQHEEAQAKERHELDQRALRLEESEKTVQQADLRLKQASHDRDVEAVRRQTQLDAKLKELTDREARVAERERASELKHTQLEGKERQTAQQQQELAVDKHNVQSQLKLIEQERELCKRLSGEVLKREATVRQVETALLQAKDDVDRLEQDLAGRAKTLMADEAAVKKWAVDLERREMTLQSIIEQLHLKGIQVSVQ